MVWEKTCILLPSFLPYSRTRQYRALFVVPFLQSSYDSAVLTSVLAAVITCGLQCDGTRMRCPQHLVCGHILYNQAMGFLVLLQKVFLVAHNSTVLLSYLDRMLQWSNSVN